MIVSGETTDVDDPCHHGGGGEHFDSAMPAQALD
jgi:hypothetical protein